MPGQSVAGQATVKQLLQQATDLLIKAGGDPREARLDAELMLGHLLDKSRAGLMTWPDAVVESDKSARFWHWVEERSKGRPLAYLLGYWEFWGLKLKVDPCTLIPRPETELLVEIALRLDLPEQAKVLDLGTGTGAIALALASERPEWQIQGVDKVSEAVALARENAQAHDMAQVAFYESDWFQGIKAQHFDLILSNPPYISEDSPYLKQKELGFEADTALIAQQGGMADIEEICASAGCFLKAGGVLIVEHGFDQSMQVHNTFLASGFVNLHEERDLNNLPRLAYGSWP